MLRDFIYLDEERLRSFAAQLLEGVPDTQTAASEHEAGGGGAAEGGVPFLAKVSGEANYLYRRSTSETRSLHHHVYSLVEDALESDLGLVDLDSNYDYASGWRRDTFADGQFVRVRGVFRFIDLEKSLNVIGGFPKLFKAFEGIQRMSINQRKNAGDLSAAEATKETNALRQQSTEMKSMPFGDVAQFAQFFGATNGVRLKIRPAGAPRTHVLVGNVHAEALIDTPLTLGSLDSPAENSWVAVGQVSPAPATITSAIPMPTGNAMEDQLEGAALALGGLTKSLSEVSHPAMRFTPLAIYREIRDAS